jgi:hypothetical protein
MRIGNAHGLILLANSEVPHFVKIEPPSDTDIAEILQQIRRRVIRTLRRLGYLVQGRSFQVGEGWHSNVNAVRFGNSSPRIPKETHVRC